MRLRDMTIAEISEAAEENAGKYEPQCRDCSKEAFREGVCWAFNHLLQNGHEAQWCNQIL